MASGGLAAASEFAVVFLVRPVLAIAFVFTLILLSWYVAWRTVLVHVPLVQEIAGLRPKKPVKPKPANRGRFAKFYQNQAEAAQRSKLYLRTTTQASCFCSSGCLGTSNQKEHLKRNPSALCNKYLLQTIVCKFPSSNWNASTTNDGIFLGECISAFDGSILLDDTSGL
ncbi:uncharacterized protein [Miscanthus floridulus]|uniref:uncharacterized protein isoform X1 n=1 Tax=Miscanthus floridulus TaxID=154761 RepID=UPI0034592C7F